jgi:hypothetical protein
LWSLYDNDAGYLTKDDVHHLFELIYTVAVDVVCATLVELNDVLGGASLSHSHSHSILMHGRIRQFVAALEESFMNWTMSGASDNRYYFTSFFEWAVQEDRYLRWRGSAIQLWRGSILDYESSVLH